MHNFKKIEVAKALGIKAFRHEFGDMAGPGYLIHPGDIRIPLGMEATALPFAEF
jgi:hypothetical protein